MRSELEKRKHGPGALALLGSAGGVPRVSRVHSLLANFKYKNKLVHGKGKARTFRWSVT